MYSGCCCCGYGLLLLWIWVAVVVNMGCCCCEYGLLLLWKWVANEFVFGYYVDDIYPTFFCYYFYVNGSKVIHLCQKSIFLSIETICSQTIANYSKLSPILQYHSCTCCYTEHTKLWTLSHYIHTDRRWTIIKNCDHNIQHSY